MEEARLDEAEGTASPDSGALLERLLAYMVGMPPEEVSRMVGEYASRGGKPQDSSGLFRYLSARGRRYQVLWAGLAFSEVISILFAAVLGPGKEVLFSGAAALPLRGDNGVLKLWNRALELAVGAPLPSVPEKVSEGDLMMAGRAARQLELKLWPQWIPRFAAGLDNLRPAAPEVSEGVILLEDGALTIELSTGVSRDVRDEAGKGLGLSFLRGALVALPELRDLGLEIGGLSSALDRYVDSAVSKVEEEPSVDVPPNQVFERAPDVDPIQGVPISDLRPGDAILLERRGKPSDHLHDPDAPEQPLRGARQPGVGEGDLLPVRGSRGHQGEGSRRGGAAERFSPVPFPLGDHRAGGGSLPGHPLAAFPVARIGRRRGPHKNE
jgi:hypothetical protein